MGRCEHAGARVPVPPDCSRHERFIHVSRVYRRSSARTVTRAPCLQRLLSTLCCQSSVVHKMTVSRQTTVIPVGCQLQTILRYAGLAILRHSRSSLARSRGLDRHACMQGSWGSALRGGARRTGGDTYLQFAADDEFDDFLNVPDMSASNDRQARLARVAAERYSGRSEAL